MGGGSNGGSSGAAEGVGAGVRGHRDRTPGWPGLGWAGQSKLGILLGTLCVLLQQIIYLNYFLTESQWACV